MNLNSLPHVHLFPPPFVSVASEQCSMIAYFLCKNLICKRQIRIFREGNVARQKKGTNKRVFVLFIFKLNRCFVETIFCVRLFSFYIH